MSYAGFEITRVRATFWIARRRTKEAIYQLAPRASLRLLQAAIDEHLAALTWDELVAA